MNKLFINNIQAIIDDSQKILFSYKVNSLDDFTIINVPVSKTIQLPRCQVNDEIFGYIGELQRYTFNLDAEEKVAISFNQTKKVSYELYDGGELVSEGNIIVEGINEDNYELTLYDKLINTLEEFDGDEDGNGYLNSLDLYKAGTNNKIEFSLYSDELITSTQDKNLKYTVNITDDDLKDSNFRCIDSSTNKPATFTLDEDLTQLQARTIKAYDVEYAVPINGVIESINKKYSDIITVDSKLSTYFDELHLHCGKPTVEVKQSDTLLNTWTDLSSIYVSFVLAANRLDYIRNNVIVPFKDNANNYITKKNGKYYIELPYRLTFSQGSDSEILSAYNNDITHFNGVNYSFGNIPYNQKIGELFLNVSLGSYNTSTNVVSSKTLPITNQINMIYGRGTTITTNQSYRKRIITVDTILVMEFETYPLLNKDILNDQLCLILNFDNLQSNTWIFGKWLSNRRYTINHTVLNRVTSGGRLTFNENDKLHSGDIVNGKNIYPKISIKEFLLNLTKYHNLKIEAINGKINISKKIYQDQNELIEIVNITNVNPKLFDFSKLQITYELPDNDLINKNYSEVNKQKYGQKNINLNYSIKKTVKKIDYSVGIPAFMKDTSKTAYAEFGDYYSAGRSRSRYGVTSGFNGKIVFCFLNLINDGKQLYLANDTYFEGGMISVNETGVPSDVSFIKTNLYVTYNNGQYTFNNTSTFTNQASIITSYYTTSPYIFNTDGSIKKSLEINKPKYNYANITDTQYTDDVTHYDKFLKKTVEEIYNVNNHILECDVIFENKPSTDKIYKFKNVEYIIQDIPEYDKSENYIKGVKLLRINNKDNYLYPYGKEEGNITVLNYTNVTKNSMTVNNRINYSGGDTIVTGGVKYGLSPDSLTNTVTTTNPAITFGINLTGLTKNTLYYIQPYMISATGIYTYGTIYSKRTLDDFSTPTVAVTGYENLSYTSVKIGGSISSEGGYPITEYGFVYGTSVNPTTSNGKKITGTAASVGTYSDTLTNLTPNTTYYIRAYAINQNGTAYSPTNISVKTIPLALPMLDTVDPYEIRQNDGYCGGFHIVDGGSPITQRGIVIKVGGGGNPTITNYDFISYDGTGTEDWITYFSGLTGNEGYVVASYATNAVGTGYGQEITFATLPIKVPTVYTNPNVLNLTNNSCDVTGIMIYNGGDLIDIEEYGFVISSSTSTPIVGGTGCYEFYSDVPTYGNLIDGDDFGYSLSGLNLNTYYYYRAFVINSLGIGYGDVQTFYTYPNNPTVDNPIFERPYDYSPNAYFSFDYNSNGYEIYSYGAVFSTSNTTPEVGIDDYIVFYNKQGSTGSSGVNFTKTSGFGDTMVGEWYCRMFIYTSLGYIYSTVINDTSFV